VEVVKAATGGAEKAATAEAGINYDYEENAAMGMGSSC